jgi:hypothetical protein
MADPMAALFTRFRDTAGYPTVFRVERRVLVDISRVFPGVGARRRQDDLPLWIRASGL